MNRVFEHPKLLANGKVNPLAAISEHCCGTTTTALMLAFLVSTRHCTTCSVRFGCKVCFLTSMVTYALVSPLNAANDRLSSHLVYCNLCTFHVVLGTVSLFFFSFSFFLGYRGIVHPPSADEGTERTWMKVPNEPGLSPNNGLEHVSLSDQSMASNPRKGQIPIFARATVVVRYCDPDCPTIIGSVVTLYP